MTLMTSPSRQCQEHHRDCSQDIVIHYHLITSLIIKASLERSTSYLEPGCRPDISYITHQCARFSNEPKVKHGKVIRWLARYLKGTDMKGLILKPNCNQSLEVYVDSDFAGSWD
jgi:hypothetical protein